MTLMHPIHGHVNILTVLCAITASLFVLVLASPAQAEIVYHSADITISDGTYNLDLNGDGVTDFTIASTKGSASCGYRCWEHWIALTETPAPGNGAILGPLGRGQEIGPNQVYSGAIALLSEFRLQFNCNTVGLCHTTFTHRGPWWGKTGYLGLSFQVNGQTYYGWAQLSVEETSATLTGYAFETIPARAIKAGETSYAWFSPISLSFGKVTVGTTVSRSVTLTNLGPTTLTITNATVTGTDAADFASLNGNLPCAGNLAAGAKCTLTFSFTPSVVGKESAAYFVYDDGGSSPQTVSLSGTSQ